MQIASILSDLTSLRVCDHSAALALVSVHKASGDSEGNTSSPTQPQDDPDMQRATDLVELHYGVKMSHVQGEDAGLNDARREVDGVLKRFENGKSSERMMRRR